MSTNLIFLIESTSLELSFFDSTLHTAQSIPKKPVTPSSGKYLISQLMKNAFSLSKPAEFEGDFYTDEVQKTAYATDASAYREFPCAVARPKTPGDIKKLIVLAKEHQTGIIPRAGGTSLAGQVVGAGIAVDVTKYLNKIIEVNSKEKYVRVEPGIVRDELNRALTPHKMFFAPETSTSNRAAVGGMAGNNSCGANSIKYGNTRDKILEIKALLSSGEEVTFKPLTQKEFEDKLNGTTSSPHEREIYNHINNLLSNEQTRNLIAEKFPKKEVTRRNHGYALDAITGFAMFGGSDQKINLCKLIAGSEGTLVFITELKLALDPVPDEPSALLCIHFEDLYSALESAVLAGKYDPHAVELMDHHILERTKDNIKQRENRFFVQGNPAAVLVVKLSGRTPEDLSLKTTHFIEELKSKNYGFHYPVVTGTDCDKVWELRKAGLGLLSNKPGDAKPAPVIEDTAVAVADLPAYIKDFNLVLKKYNLECVHYAHAGAGELHLRPVLNLKTNEGRILFRTILAEIAELVKKYRGCLSGEHGDGRLRGEFIPFMLGEEIYGHFKELKKVWDPSGIMNPGKIVNTPPMDTSLRNPENHKTPKVATVFRWDSYQGYVRAAEQCNGSGDCRKSALAGGTMCPTYQVTGDETQTTRARANLLREAFSTRSEEEAFTSREVKTVTDTCIGCKGCKAECPSNVDLTRLKAEFDYGYGKRKGVRLSTRLTAGFDVTLAAFSAAPPLFKFFTRPKGITGKILSSLGFSLKRNLPVPSKTPLTKWYHRHYKPPHKIQKEIFLFADIFTTYTDTEIGIKAVKLLTALNYKVNIIPHADSGRTYLSKGLLKQARQRANKNVRIFANCITADAPLIGIEPSAILSFRDEYPDLVDSNLRQKAAELSKNSFLIDEFLSAEFDAGNISKAQFRSEPREILIHGHCHQKALSSQVHTKKILQIPKNFTARLIPSGCCGMAGSFGYMEKNYAISMQIGEMVLFPAVRENPDKLIAATGHSCRHQINDGTGVKALHPVEILYDALRDEFLE